MDTNPASLTIFGVGIICTALFIWMLYRAMLKIAAQGERYQSWARRDEELNRRFLAALERGDYAEADRAKYQLNRNHEAYNDFK